MLSFLPDSRINSSAVISDGNTLCSLLLLSSVVFPVQHGTAE